ncbi:drug resistance transporter, EmrB/QacA subfamily [Friedmanniella luteola]|uniref:Drug resistance transporter, EmrB/QacA subfamily n=1 Tax=Friedmanniella luteola TaxID=546871 RepID=A0A1H1MQN4_9ACTN|nr:MFS transporter [Friedmanniella luteola]SDR89101.1 drug resistance transporter, EmrB/QacA subfamily [Friedmanniella luteola]
MSHALHHSTAAAPPTPTKDAQPRRPWSVMVLALTAQVLVVLDISVVNTAMPVIGRELGLAGGDLQWMVTAYLLLSGGGLLLGGRIADLLPRRRVFLTGLTLFTAASLGSGFASSASQLIAGRALQGAGAALMTPAALALIMTTYSGAQRARGLALWGAIGGLGVAAGVVVGGALTTWTGWQTIFWVNVPVGVVALAAAAHLLPRGSAGRLGATRFDVLGAATLVAGLATLMFTLARIESRGWASVWTLAGLVIAAAAVVAFLLVERRAPAPLIPPHTWRIASLVWSTLVMLGITGLLIGTVFLTSNVVQTTLGYSALTAGLAFLPLATALVVGTHVAAHAAAHLSGRVIAAVGLVVVAGGSLLLARVTAAASYRTDLLPGLVVVGLGSGLVFVAVSAAAMRDIPVEHAGLASGFLMTGHEVGAALGVAVLSAVATAAGPLTTPDGAAAAVAPGFITAAGIAAALAVVALLRMPATRGAAGPIHLH